MNTTKILVTFSIFSYMMTFLHECLLISLILFYVFVVGIAPDTLIAFLENNFPKKKKSKHTLGILDPKLGANIHETAGIQCTSSGVVPEITRGLYF